MASVPPGSLVGAILAMPLVVIVGGMVIGGWVAGTLLSVGLGVAIVAIFTTLNRQRKLAADPREQRRREVRLDCLWRTATAQVDRG